MNSTLDESNTLSEISSFPSFVRRRSRIGAASNNPLLISHIAENDDDSERAYIRRQSIPSSPTSSVGSSRRSLAISHNIAQMLPAQVQEGIDQCIKLNVENKINIKNAYNLKIIDFMMYIVRKNDMESNTLQMATCALDVSAKVYSLRVDSLHHMVVGLSKETISEEDKFAGANDNGETYNNDNYDGRANAETQKKKINKNHCRRLTTIGALQGEVDIVTLESTIIDTDFLTTDMLLQVTIPQHCDQGLQLHLHRDVILDNSDDITADEESSKRIKWPMVYIDDRAVIDSSLIDFQFLDWSLETKVDNTSSISCNEPGISPLIDDRFVFDLNANLPQCDEIVASNAHVEEVMDIEEHEFIDRNAPADKQVDHIVDAHHDNSIGLMARGGPPNLEYSFFIDSIKIKFAGPTHWKVKGNMKMRNRDVEVGAAGLAPRRRRGREFILQFNEETMNIAQEVLIQEGKGKIRHNLWNESKLTLPRDIQFDLDNMKKCSLRADDIIEFTQRQPMNATALSEIMDGYNYNNQNDQEFCGAIFNNANTYDHADVNDKSQPNYSVGTFASQSDNTFNANAMTQHTESSFMGDDYTEMPKLIQILQISYIRQAKKINMRKLKEAIRIKLVSMTNDSEKLVDNKSQHETALIEDLDFNSNTRRYIGPQIRFSQVYSELPSLLSRKDASQLSFHIALVALLHLANEKNLTILNANLDDYFISLPSI